MLTRHTLATDTMARYQAGAESAIFAVKTFCCGEVTSLQSLLNCCTGNTPGVPSNPSVKKWHHLPSALYLALYCTAPHLSSFIACYSFTGIAISHRLPDLIRMHLLRLCSLASSLQWASAMTWRSELPAAQDADGGVQPRASRPDVTGGGTSPPVPRQVSLGDYVDGGDLTRTLSDPSSP